MESVSCLICRRRKVRIDFRVTSPDRTGRTPDCSLQIKCDRTPGACHKCRKLGEQCVYSVNAGVDFNAVHASTSSNDYVTQAGLKRRRILRSCVECKIAKAKCYGSPICERCAKRNLECSFSEVAARSREDALHRDFNTAASASASVSASVPGWLMDKQLPPIDRLQELVDLYFAHIHSVRCMGFLHIPSFMERLKDSDQVYSTDSGLIYAMCALAAPFYYAKVMGVHGDDLDPTMRFFEAGKGWATTAMSLMFSNFGRPGIESLMTDILLHEYHLRVGDYAKGFLISGLISRHMQVLQLNIEHDFDILCQKNTSVSWATKESRRRLAWTCYLLDAFIECGIDQLRFVSVDDIQVQLPCLEDLFVRNIPCVTEMLPRGKLLPFVDAAHGNGAADNLDLRAFYIRAMDVRSKILKYVKHLEGEVPWDTGGRSQFSALNRELVNLENSIPSNMKISPGNTYLFKSYGRLNLYFGLHILISQTFNDLYRVGVSQLVFPNTATKWIRENAPDAFIRLCHRTCASKAVYIASLLKELWDCHRPSIVDVPYVVHTQVCSSVLVTSLLSWPHSEPPLPQYSYRSYQELLESNVRILQYLQRYIKTDVYTESASQALRRFNMVFSPEGPPQRLSPLTGENVNDTGTAAPPLPPPPPPQYSLEYILSPLGTYPFARKQVYDRHKPETSGVEDAATPADHQLGVSDPSPTPTLSVMPEMGNGLMSSGDIFLTPILDWESEVPLMDGMGYPTFLEQYSQGHET